MHPSPGHRMYPERIPYLIDIPQIALGDLFVQAAARYGDRPALSFGGRLWTLSLIHI